MVTNMVLRACRANDYVFDRARDDRASVGHQGSNDSLGASLDILVHSGQVLFGAAELGGHAVCASANLEDDEEKV